MQSETLIGALILGLVEGLTEFIPVSSTGHILLLGHFIGFQSTGKTFEVLIQLGAILAILTVYAHRLIAIALALPHQASARRFVFGVLLAFLPAAVIGVMLHGFIKTVLFESPAHIQDANISYGGDTMVGTIGVRREKQESHKLLVNSHQHSNMGISHHSKQFF